MKNAAGILVFVGTFIGCHAVTTDAMMAGIFISAFGVTMYLATKLNPNLKK